MVEISFYLLSFIAVAMLLLLFQTYSSIKVIKLLSTGMFCWIAYLFMLHQNGALRNFELPPRIPLLVVFPAVFLIILVVNRPFMKQALATTPMYIPIALQSFRVFVELLIFATYKKGIFPQRATFEGLNFDILVGISALFIGVAVAKGVLKNTGILVWHFISLSILSVTVYSFISTYYFGDFGASANRLLFVEFPYLLLASVLLPTAIFLHVFSIKQLRIKRQMKKSTAG